MKRTARHEKILTALSRGERVEVAALAPQLGVSEMTIRRDFEELERVGQCRRVHGGAVRATSGSYEPPFGVRSGQAARAKRAIALEVASLLQDGDTVLLDIGTTTLEVAHALQGRSNLSVLTPSIQIASLLADEPGIRAICLGGVVRPSEHSVVSSLTELCIRQFHVDVCVLGIGGVDVRAGLTEFNLDDAAIKRAQLERCRQAIVAADSSKIGKVAFADVARLEEIDTLVTDANGSAEMLNEIRDIGVDVRAVGEDE